MKACQVLAASGQTDPVLASSRVVSNSPINHAAPRPSAGTHAPCTLAPHWYTGEWKAGKRHGVGLMVYADGTSFKGRWEGGAWVQSAADPARCRLRGAGLARAVAGQAAAFRIQVSAWWTSKWAGMHVLLAR